MSYCRRTQHPLRCRLRLVEHRERRPNEAGLLLKRLVETQRIDCGGRQERYGTPSVERARRHKQCLDRHRRMLLARRQVQRPETSLRVVRYVIDGWIRMAVSHHLDEARSAPDVFDAYLDVVNHEPAEPPYHGHGPLRILAFPKGNQ